MRIALISLLPDHGSAPATGDWADLVPGALLIGGRSIVRHQLALALALGCETIAVQYETVTDDIYDLQDHAARHGVRVKPVTHAHALVGLVGPEDTLIAFAPGLLVEPAAARDLIEQQPGAVLTVPPEGMIEAGFIPLGLNHAAAGLLAVSGRVVAQLGDYPADSDPHALLVQLACQANHPLRMVPDAVIARGGWQRIRDDAEAAEAEARWLRQATAAAAARGPSPWLAVQLVRALGPMLLEHGVRPWLIALVAGVLVLLGLAGGVWGLAGGSLLLLALAALIGALAQELGRIEQAGQLDSSPPAVGGMVLDLGIDAGLVLVPAMAGAAMLGTVAAVIDAGFAPMVLVLQFRVFPRLRERSRWITWVCDRMVAAVLLAGLGLVMPLDLPLRIAVVAMLLAVWADLAWPVPAGEAGSRGDRVGRWTIFGRGAGDGPSAPRTGTRQRR